MDSQGANVPATPSSGEVSTKVDEKSLPVIDVSALVQENPTEEALKLTAKSINEACRNWGFFYIINHGVSTELQEKLESQ